MGRLFWYLHLNWLFSVGNFQIIQQYSFKSIVLCKDGHIFQVRLHLNSHINTKLPFSQQHNRQTFLTLLGKWNIWAFRTFRGRKRETRKLGIICMIYSIIQTKSWIFYYLTHMNIYLASSSLSFWSIYCILCLLVYLFFLFFLEIWLTGSIHIFVEMLFE